MNDDRTLERAARSWLEEGPVRAPDRPVDAALAEIQKTRQERGFVAPWRFEDMNPPIRLAGIALVVIVAVGAGIAVLRPQGVTGPGTSVTPRPAPSTNDVPVAPATALANPSGSGIPVTLMGRTYRADPPDGAGGEELVLTLRSPEDGHCVAMYAGRSTCFTLLWAPFRIEDPGARGAARIVDGNLILTFDIVPFDEQCVGETGVYAIEGGGSRLRGIDTPGCSFQDFVEIQ
jgi:hypothetical protein